jgi:hypothetical protein
MEQKIGNVTELNDDDNNILTSPIKDKIFNIKDSIDDDNFIFGKDIIINQNEKYSHFTLDKNATSDELQPLLINKNPKKDINININTDIDSDDEIELCDEDICNIVNDADYDTFDNESDDNSEDESANDTDCNTSDNESDDNSEDNSEDGDSEIEDDILLEDIDITDDNESDDTKKAAEQSYIVSTFSTNMIKNIMSDVDKLNDRPPKKKYKYKKLPDLPSREPLPPMRKPLPPTPSRKRALFAFSRTHRFIKYNCPECESGFYTESSLNNHYFQHHINDTDRWKCNKCGEILDDGDDLEDHMEICDVVGDIIPTSEDGTYICPNCNNKYVTATLLGEHFTLSHNSYTENSSLDRQKDGGFPGFDILEMIGMIVFRDEIDKLGMNYELDFCPICRCKYSTYIPQHIQQSSQLKRSQSDTNLLKVDKNNASYISYKEDHDISSTEISNKEIINKMNLRSEYMKPHFTLCCKAHSCGLCIINAIKYQNNLKCLFCTKNHEPEYSGHFKIIDDTGDCNNSWNEWWSNHKSILNNSTNYKIMSTNIEPYNSCKISYI